MLSLLANKSAVCLLCTRYVFRKQEAGVDGLGKRCRSSSVPDDSPSGKRTRAGGDDDALLKSVAQLEHSNQVCFVKDCCATTVVMPVFRLDSWHPFQCALIILMLAHHVIQLSVAAVDEKLVFTGMAFLYFQSLQQQVYHEFSGDAGVIHQALPC